MGIKGDPEKKPAECEYRHDGGGLLDAHCPHLKETGGGFEGERYRCEVCGESFFLDYDEMR